MESFVPYVSDGANFHFPFLAPTARGSTDPSSDDAPWQKQQQLHGPAHMQITSAPRVSSRKNTFTDEILSCNSGTDPIIPLGTPSEMERRQQLSLVHGESSSSSTTESDNSLQSFSKKSMANKLFIITLLFFINVLNYMDRYTITGVLMDVKNYYAISNGRARLLQLLFIVAYMLFAPLFGYLGDRYNRIIILMVSVAFWCSATLFSSFISSEYFWLFAILRSAVGIGEASYSTVTPTIIADLFVNDLRTSMLTLFYFAIPIGSGLGYIIGSHIQDAFGHWQWALRVTPIFGIISVILLAIFVHEPPRGELDGTQHQQASWLNDISALLRNKSFTFSTLGFTAVCFVYGSLAHWMPYLMEHAFKVRGEDYSNIALTFSGLMVATGIGGVLTGSLTSWFWKNHGCESADALVCAFSLLLCAPFLVAIIIFCPQSHTYIFWMVVFSAEFFLCLNLAVIADILLYIVIPTRRSTAEAFQILISHLFGDAGLPYIIGLIAEALTDPMDESALAKLVPLKKSMFMTVIACVVGGLLFLLSARFIIKDKRRAKELGALESMEGVKGDGLSNIYPINNVVTEAQRQNNLLLYTHVFQSIL